MIKITGFGRDGEKLVELCLEASQSFQNLAFFRRYVLPGECYIDVFMALLGVIFLT